MPKLLDDGSGAMRRRRDDMKLQPVDRWYKEFMMAAIITVSEAIIQRGDDELTEKWKAFIIAELGLYPERAGP